MKILTHFLACWLITYLVMSLWLFEAMTGYQMSDPIPVTLVCAVVAYAVYLPFAWMSRVRPLAKLFGVTMIGAGRSLDDALFRWPCPTKDPFTVRDMLKSVEIKGVTGSGKSSGSGNYILNAIVAHPRSNVMIIGQKPEDRDNAVEIFKRHGKLDKLIIIEEGGDKFCSFFDYARESGMDAAALTELTTTLSEGLQAGQAGGRSDDRFWRMLESRITFNAIEAVRQGTDKVTPDTLMDFITTAPNNIQTLTDKDLRLAWEQKFHFKTMHAAEKRKKTTIEEHDWQVVKSFWATEFPLMDDKPKSSGLAGIYNTLHNANTGLSRSVTGMINNVSPRMVDDGYSFMINFPYSVYGPAGRYIAGGWKYLLQQHILKRQWKPDSFWNVLVCDEMQESITQFDPRYLAMCRSHGGCVLSLTQTIHSEAGAMRSHNDHDTKAWLSNYGTHVVHTVDAETAKYYSELLGYERELFISVTPKEQSPMEGELLGSGKGAGFSTSEQYQPILQSRIFMSGLRTGGSANKNCVDGIVIKIGEPFSDGNNWQRCTFRQT